MEIRPILSSLRRHKLAAALIIVEIALACAIVCNATFVIGSRIQHMQRESGIAEDELVDIEVATLNPDRNIDAGRREDIAALSAVPGVKAVSSFNMIPYGENTWMSGVNLAKEQPEPNLSAYTYMDDGGMLPTFGLTILEGRTFTPEEYVDLSEMEKPGSTTVFGAALVTRTLAQHLFHGESALGKTVYVWGENPIRIVGVVNDLVGPGNSRASVGGSNEDYDSIILPGRVSNGSFALRTTPERRDEVMKAAIAALNKVDANRIFNDQRTITDMRHDFYSRDRAVVWLLIAVSITLLAVTALGIAGLASFWVQQRTKQIGVRRALGATKGQILSYFQSENFILTSCGIVLGMLLAFAINQLLMSRYELTRLPWFYLPVGAVLLWVLGQLAVLGPARKAASVPPAIATRSA
ncbi:ABC transporter permease [Pseudoxanthomonas kalamensis DSM 18571]|uniref:ABC transporter permease n=1 Tax=Pseudoxanthomonas kalamensis TaxID=289483 RepID=UPI0013908265|nr:FtsX-like permease family protein [Pseudoxanthomonas kalamensis]KAF1712591.1 ABC transporter permease [Pseudoxanthomonas kalamensis DSM 18571]